MANHSAGDALGWRHAVVLYKAQSVRGTAVTPDTTCGLAQVRYTKHGGAQFFEGPGTNDYQAVKGGEVYTDFEIRWEAILSGIKSLLLNAFPTSGELPWLSFAFGWLDDNGTPTGEVDRIQDCKIGSLELSLDASNGHGPLTGSISGEGGLITEVTTPLSPVTSATFPWYTYEGVFTKGGSAYPIRSFSVRRQTTLRRDHHIPGAAPASFVRGFTDISTHNKQDTGEISRYQDSGVNVQASALPTHAMQLVLTSLSSGNPTLTFAFSEAAFLEEQVGQDANGLFWTLPYRGKLALS